MEHMGWRSSEISSMLGVTLTRIEREAQPDMLTFFSECGRRWRMYHQQDCCEQVEIEELVGELDDLVGAPILVAEERVNEGKLKYGDTETWTFYELATIRGSVTLRWYGTSNGYYSERVHFEEGPSVEELLKR